MLSSKNSVHKVLITGFLILISLPPFFSILGIKTGDTFSENRKIGGMPTLEFNYPVAFPSLKLKATTIYITCARFIRKFDDYYSSTFSFRADLLSLYTTIKLNIFHTNPLPLKVVEGKNGWFFLGDSNSNIIKESKGLENFSKKELDNILGKISERNIWLNKKGIQLYISVAPNKLSVYGEYLPIQKSDKKTMAEQIDSASVNNFNFIDLKSNFYQAPYARLFFKTDSHWNDAGAFLGYTSLMEKIKSDFPEAHILQQSDFSADTLVSYQQDLTRMLSIHVREEIITFNLKKPAKAVLKQKQLLVPKNYDRHPDDYEERYKSDVNHLKVLVFRDSFTTHLVKYLKESFGETVFIWRHQFDQDLIEREKPDIVIQIIVERNLELMGR